MTLRIALVVLATALPGIASAQMSCAEKHQAQNCVEGTTWNSETQACEVVVTG